MCHKNVSLTQEVSGRDQLQSLFLIIHQPLCPAVPLRLVNIREDVSLPPAVPSQHPPFTVKTGSGWTFQRSNYHLVWFTCESSYLHQPPASNLPFTKSIRMHLHLDILLYKPEDICDVMSSLGGISHMSHHTVKPILPLGRAWCHLKGRRSSLLICWAISTYFNFTSSRGGIDLGHGSRGSGAGEHELNSSSQVLLLLQSCQRPPKDLLQQVEIQQMRYTVKLPKVTLT